MGGCESVAGSKSVSVPVLLTETIARAEGVKHRKQPALPRAASTAAWKGEAPHPPAGPGLRANTCGDKWHESGTMCPSHGDRDAQNAWHESHAFDCAHLTVDQDPRPSLRLCLHLLHNLEEILKVLASVVAVCLHTPCTP